MRHIKNFLVISLFILLTGCESNIPPLGTSSVQQSTPPTSSVPSDKTTEGVSDFNVSTDSVKAADETFEPQQESLLPSAEPTPEPSPLAISEPELPPEPEKISTSSTKIFDNHKNRIHNINMACEKVNEYVVNPEEVFSFNEIVGERSKKTGFKEAIILIGKERAMGYGGGICQLSTTIFQAARSAGLEIVERHPHQKKIDYADIGDDATVSYGSFDLKFKNNTERPIVIHAWIDEKNVNVDLIQ